MRKSIRFGVPLVAGLLLGACAGHPPLTPLAPVRAASAVDDAQRAFTADPSDAARLRLGEAQVRAARASAALATLQPLLATTGETGARANLYAALANERLGNLDAAEHGYQVYLAAHDDGAVRARLAAVSRRRADVAARAAVASERTIDAGTFGARTVGVAPLAVSAADTSLAPLGYGLADLLITDLSRSRQIQVVDRLRMDALLRELQLAQSGRVDSATAPRVGRLVGARRLVSGAIGQLPGDKLAVSSRVADVASGGFVGSPVTERTSLDDILDAEKSLAFSIFDQLGVTLTPAEHAAIEQRPTRSLAAFLAYSRGARAEVLGDFTAARAYFRQAVLIDPGFTAAGNRLASVPAGPSTSTASVALPQPLTLTTLSSVLDALNPSPAAFLGPVRDRGNASEQATFANPNAGSIIIHVYIP